MPRKDPSLKKLVYYLFQWFFLAIFKSRQIPTGFLIQLLTLPKWFTPLTKQSKKLKERYTDICPSFYHYRVNKIKTMNGDVVRNNMKTLHVERYIHPIQRVANELNIMTSCSSFWYSRYRISKHISFCGAHNLSFVFLSFLTLTFITPNAKTLPIIVEESLSPKVTLLLLQQERCSFAHKVCLLWKDFDFFFFKIII